MSDPSAEKIQVRFSFFFFVFLFKFGMVSTTASVPEFLLSLSEVTSSQVFK